IKGGRRGGGAKTEGLPEGGILGQESIQLRGFECPQHHPHHRQQQEGQAGEGTRTTPLAFGRRFHIVFFNLLHYLEQCVGGDGVEVGSHKPQSLQSGLALCYTRPIYAQASIKKGDYPAVDTGRIMRGIVLLIGSIVFWASTAIGGLTRGRKSVRLVQQHSKA